MGGKPGHLKHYTRVIVNPQIHLLILQPLMFLIVAMQWFYIMEHFTMYYQKTITQKKNLV